MNAVLHHCSLPAMRVASGSRPRDALFPPDEADGGEAGDELDADEDVDDDAPPALLAPVAGAASAVLRPGIVHRLDKGCASRRIGACA